MVEVKNLYKNYVDRNGSFEALKGINVTIEKGEIFGFIGLSGAGKTSLARCISCLEKVSGGEIIINGIDITKLSGEKLRQERKKLGVVFQHFNLLMNSTVFDNVAFPLVIDKKPKDYVEKRVMELLDIVGLIDKKNSYPSKLSGGQKQRVGIARALVANPEVVICDEATSALDPKTSKSILELIKRINEDSKITFIVITHEMNVIRKICSKVAVLEDGIITEQGLVENIVCNPQTSISKMFFEI